MSSIELKTEIPGPRSTLLKQRAGGSVPRAIGPGGDIFIEEGSGALVRDVDGNTFIDFIGGVGALAVGHSHPNVVEAIMRQAKRFTHTDFSLVPYDSYLELAERISHLCGGDRKVAFFNSGAEAVENAVKVARHATGKPGIICFEGAFHGRTYMAMTLTAREVPVKDGFGPFIDGVYRVPYPNLKGTTLHASMGAIRDLIETEQIAAVIVEPILGEGGFVVPPPEFLGAVKELTEGSGSLLIADEIQTGYGRTGEFLAVTHSGVRPDLITLGKSIAAGLPLSAIVGEPKFIDSPPPNALGGTYPGNPIACAVGLAVLDIFEEEGLVERSREIGELLRKGWNEIADSFDGIKEIRGLGSMVGVEFRDGGDVRRILDDAKRSGVLALSAGADADVIRHLVPFVISSDQIEEALDVFRKLVT